MANSLSKSVVLDGWRNAVVELTGILDTSDVSVIPAVSLTDFHNNSVTHEFVGFRVDKVSFVISDGLTVQLAWHSDQLQTILALSGRGDVCAKVVGGLQPDQTKAGYDGSIDLITSGFSLQPVFGTTQSYSVLLVLTKLYTV